MPIFPVRGAVMKLSEVFKSGRTEKASEVSEELPRSASGKRTGPILDNRESSKFAAIDMINVGRGFNDSFDKISDLDLDKSSKLNYEDESDTMDNMINYALDKYERRRKYNFLFDRMKAISGETKRININLDMEIIGDKR